MRTITRAGTVPSLDWLVTFVVEDAITREHAISLASHEAYAQGLGDADLWQSWSMVEDGQENWYVQFHVSNALMEALA